MKWNLVIAKRAAHDLRSVPRTDLSHIDAAFDAMCVDPYDGDLKFLRATGGALRRRVGAWRIIFEVLQQERMIVILAVKRRSSNTY